MIFVNNKDYIMIKMKTERQQDELQWKRFFKFYCT